MITSACCHSCQCIGTKPEHRSNPQSLISIWSWSYYIRSYRSTSIFFWSAFNTWGMTNFKVTRLPLSLKSVVKFLTDVWIIVIGTKGQKYSYSKSKLLRTFLSTVTQSCVQTTTLSCHVWFEKVSMSVSDVYQYSTSTLSYFDSLASVDFGGDSSCPEIESVHNNSELILAPDWSRLITWPEYWPVIGPDSDWFSQLSLSDLARQAKQLQTAGYQSSLATTAFSLLLSLLWGEDSRLTTEVKSLSRLLSRIPVGFSRPFLIGAKQETD